MRSVPATVPAANVNVVLWSFRKRWSYSTSTERFSTKTLPPQRVLLADEKQRAARHLEKLILVAHDRTAALHINKGSLAAPWCRAVARSAAPPEAESPSATADGFNKQMLFHSDPPSPFSRRSPQSVAGINVSASSGSPRGRSWRPMCTRPPRRRISKDRYRTVHSHELSDRDGGAGGSQG